MTEDEIYRTSTQYRMWSFTPESLASLRSTTNALAAEGVKAAVQSKRAAVEQDENGGGSKTPTSVFEADCLTVEEEQRLVGYYCMKTMDFAGFCEFPTNVMVIDSSIYGLLQALWFLWLTNMSRQQQCNTLGASICRTRP